MSSVEGMFYRTKTTMGRMPPTRKCMKRVMICATVSLVNRKDVM